MAVAFMIASATVEPERRHLKLAGRPGDRATPDSWTRRRPQLFFLVSFKLLAGQPEGPVAVRP